MPLRVICDGLWSLRDTVLSVSSSRKQEHCLVLVVFGMKVSLGGVAHVRATQLFVLGTIFKYYRVPVSSPSPPGVTI